MNTIVQPGGLPDSRAARAQEGSMVELSCATTITQTAPLGTGESSLSRPGGICADSSPGFFARGLDRT
jgi:hypothetical protein